MKPKSPFPNHSGQATWGARTVPLEHFVEAVASHGRPLEPSARQAAAEALGRVDADAVSVEGPFERVLVFGGVYNNAWALEALLHEAAGEPYDRLYCLGDLGGFGPYPEKVWPLLQQADVQTIQGNYEESLSTGHEDCNCGYTDPRDNHFAELSYEYTAARCSEGFKQWMGRLPRRRRVRVGPRELLLVHGSPRRINEFLFDSATSDAYLRRLLVNERADGVLCTHTGLHWHRDLGDDRHAVNVGVIGRPANDGRTEVWYAVVEWRGDRLQVEHRPLRYDHQGLAQAMRDEALPQPFVDTILTGWWTTCLEILPARERSTSRF